MAKIAFVFPGQGAQYSGMGKELYAHAPAAAVFDALDALRPGTAAQCFEGSIAELTETANTQPAMFAVEMAAAAALSAEGITAAAVAGFSLGELAALTYAKSVSLGDGFALVCKRGRLMADAAATVDSAMVAVLKLDAATVETLAARYDHVYPVNYNCPGQISVAGLKGELASFCLDVKAAGGRGIPLKVAGAFHSPLMTLASTAFADFLKDYEFKGAELPLYSNATGQPYEGDYASLLARQIVSPVRWQAIIEAMLAAGIDTFIELGPGTTLSGFIKKIQPAAACFHVEDRASLEQTITEVNKC